ncbi:26S proteasome complex subunit SEM1 [Entomophthora muscae]|uniref:26S proteasome complex subunit SEM1 n=2 Tax=Entomophthora muscae TaxID=34485 RepID=A0ACC2TM40_9FUNG|nr:26S proteasome complex subunit SEM1 [Entomophthora muscae]KAJ9075555.1 26S proteasome complex subunit SEM1 [Entomophthora muscae]
MSRNSRSYTNNGSGYIREAPESIGPSLASQLEALDDDDEFEQFDREDWKMIPAIPEDELWENNWDAEVQDDQFLKHLRAELLKDRMDEC